jgi:hypothetical protein
VRKSDQQWRDRDHDGKLHDFDANVERQHGARQRRGREVKVRKRAGEG